MAVGTHHPPQPSPCPGDGCIGMGGSAMWWAAGARRGAAGRFSRQVQAGSPAFTRRTTGGLGCPHSPSVVRRALSLVPPLQGCPGQPRTLVPSRSLLSPAGLGPDAAPGAEAIPHGVCLGARLGTGAACEGVGRGQPSLHEALHAAHECHQRLPEGSGILSTGVLPDVVATAVVTAETLSFPLPPLRSGCSPVPGDFVLLPGQLLLLVGVSGLVFQGAARPPLYSLARADPRAGAQRNCQLISVCAAAQSSHPAKRWASWKPLPGPVPSR